MGLIRWIFRAAAIVVVVALLLIGAAFFLVPGQRVAQVAADRLGAATGRQVDILGDTSFTIYPVLGVRTGGLRIANADWSENGPMLQSEALAIGVDLATLIGGDIRITRIEAMRPEILLEISGDGTPNWRLAGSGDTSTGAEDGPARAITLDSLQISGGRLNYMDHRDGTGESLGPLDLTLRMPDPEGAADLEGRLQRAGATLDLTAHIASARAFLEGGISDLSVALSLPGGTLDFDGRASLAPEAQGRIDVSLTDTARAVSSLGLAAPDLPQGLGRSAGLVGDVTWTREGQLSIREGAVTLDSNRLALAADVTPGTPTRLTADLSAETLDFSGLSGGDGGAAEGQSGWSTAPIDASALGLIDGEIALRAGSVDLGALTLAGLRSTLAIDRSRAVLSLHEMGVFDGAVTGQLVANNRSGLSVGGDLTAGGIGLKPMLTDLAGITRFTGAADAKVEFLGSGQSVAAIMNSLSGGGQLSTGRGTIEGIDLDRLFRTGDASGGTTIFDAASASFTMEGGVLTNEDLAMQLAGIRAEGNGQVDLGGQSVDYLFVPISIEARDGRGLAIPVRIRGPWSAPRITADLEQAIQRNFEEEKKELEQKARQEVDGKVRDALGIEAQENESLEDSLKRELGDQAERGLLKLLNR